MLGRASPTEGVLTQKRGVGNGGVLARIGTGRGGLDIREVKFLGSTGIREPWKVSMCLTTPHKGGNIVQGDGGPVRVSKVPHGPRPSLSH